MGMYTWLSDSEFAFYSSVPDADVNEALQEVRKFMPDWYISVRTEFVKRWFGKNKRVDHYTVYHRCRPDYSEVRYQISATTKETVLNLLYGLSMGYNSQLITKACRE